jgi:hypothetical protein
MTATIVVYTEKGEQVWQAPVFTAMIERLHCPGNTSGAKLARGIRQAVLEAEAIHGGRDPNEVRDIPGWNVASYTKKHMDNLNCRGRTVEIFRVDDSKDEERARSRIRNAARRLGVEVETRVETGRVIGTVKRGEA